MKKLQIIIWLLVWGNMVSAQIYPTIHFNRPRIYIDSTRFAFLQNNLATGNCGSTYSSFNNAIYSNWYNDPQLYLLGSDSTLWTWNFESQWAQYQGQFLPALYKITNDSIALKRCRFLITEINNKIDTINFSNYGWYQNETLIRNLSDVGGMLLDWCYDSLPQPMRIHLAQNLYKLYSYFMNTYILTSYGNVYVTGHNIWNIYYANQYALVLDSAEGITAAQQDSITSWYQISYDKAVNEILPVAGYYRDDDGGWNWQAAYSIWSLVDEFQFFENMRIATGKNFYSELPWIENSINQYWHFIQPDGWTINWGDGFAKRQGDRAIYRHAQIYNDPKSLWLSQFHSQPNNITWTWPLFQKLLYFDFNATPIVQPDVPHDWFSDKTGLSVSRTDWSDTATVVWVYNAPTKKAGHEHRDNNSFCIYKNAPQINNSGYYYSYGDSHYINYYMRTIAHNSICVFDSTETYSNWNAVVSNDGGQIESQTLYNFEDVLSPNAQRGSWELWGNGTNYCYTISDAEQSYDSNKLDQFRRRVLFYKPNQVIVLDHLHLVNTATQHREAKFILHFQQKPVLSGNLINTLIENHIETFNGKDIIQANGNGNVAIRTLLPVNSKTTRIGGSSYEYYVNGQNYPLSVAPDSIHTTAGKWRIEVSPTEIADSLIYLHTISIGDSANESIPGGIGQKNESTIGIDWTNTLFFFASNGNIDRLYQVMDEVPGSRSIDIFGADLVPTQLYHIKLNNVIVSTLNSDNYGVLESNIKLPIGNHKIEIVNTSISIDSTSGKKNSITIFPNPTNDILYIVTENNFNTEIEISTISGELIYEGENISKIDVSKWERGTYVISIRQGFNFYTEKFIVD